MDSVLFTCEILILIFACNAIIPQYQLNRLVQLSDIYYINPNPSSKVPEIKLSDLKNVHFKEGVKFLIHGYLANRNHIAMAPVKNAYLSKGFNGLLMADWQDASKLLYSTSRYLIQQVGLNLAKILQDFMRAEEISPDSVHIIGHSLGAHIAGVIGRYFNGTIGRVTGLDPAKPLFQGNCADCLNSNVAKFVDVIHTDFPIFGDLTPRGHVDFYPNDGSTPQPGCNLLDLLTATSCSHYRAPLFFAESVRLPNNFPSVKCTIKFIKNLRGRNCLQKRSKRAAIVMMGENVSNSSRGEYYLQTSYVPPYGFGAFSKGFRNQLKV